MTEPQEPDAAAGADDGYGDSPGVVLRRELRARPALLAVAVELAFVVVLGNQWVFDHLVTPWSLSTSPVRRGLASAVGWFSWLFVPQQGLFWVWLAGVLHVVVWLGLTYRLTRPALRSPDVTARFVATMGAVLAAAVAALVVSRLVTYADIHKLYAGGDTVGISPPGFIEWTFLSAVGGGAILAVTVVAVLAGSVLTAALPAEGAAASGVATDVAPGSAAETAPEPPGTSDGTGGRAADRD